MAAFDIFSPPLPAEAHTTQWRNLHPGERPQAMVQAAREIAATRQAPLLVITDSSEQGEQLRRELLFYSGNQKELPVYLFPDWETLPYDVFSPHQDIISERLNALYHLPMMRSGILIVPANSLMQRLPPASYIQQHSLMLHCGQELDVDAFRNNLVAAGYQHVESVFEHGEFAVRGAILDIFPMGSRHPFRIDLFDEEIETLRKFDPETQLSGDKVEEIRLLPGKEFPLTEDGRKHFRISFRERFDVDTRDCALYQDVSEGLASPGIEYYLPLFFEVTSHLFEYLPGNTVIVRSRQLDTAALRFWQDIENRYEDRRYDRHRPILPPKDIFLTPEDIFRQIKPFSVITLETPDSEPPLKSLASASTADNAMPALQAFLAEHPDYRILYCAESAGRREVLLELLKQAGVRPAPVDSWQAFLNSDAKSAMTVAALDQGLLLSDHKLALIPESQLLGRRIAQRRRRRRTQESNSDFIIKSLTELHPGSAVVHIDHGVGRYCGLETLTIEDETTEFLTLEYAKGAKLYVPVASLHLISRYGGSDPELAPIDTLGNDTWQKNKRKAAEKIRDAAAELLDIYAKREARPGYACKLEDNEYRQFAASFPFEETPDQQDAINSVLEDMRSPRSMDRLVCGDVGFGKTEVAMRAAWLAVQNGKQVTMLVPTTLLAQQHFESFRDRFADWPIQIDLMSRFRSAKEQDNTLQKLAEGKVDIVVGTHKLLNKQIKYKDLGLLIIDEEHRFGVQQKERIKALRAEVDILTLTATPIPRTLNLAMTGARDLSLIVTAPAKRLSVKTFVREHQDSLVKEAVLRELLRGGQVFYLHNEVKTIERSAEQLRELIPEARVCVAHGQMPERELEAIMADFYHKRYNILVCSTIIETGIDVPSANTIIMDRADKLGLAQLHQLRGRVGRSHHQAYAYLLTPPWKSLSNDAQKRLEAISSADTLGAGFTLASHDLEIRGAGEILGEEQTGHMQKIGFTLYTEMLEEAVKAMKEGRTPNIDLVLQSGCEINLRVPALIPDDYLPDIHTRLIMYKRIAGAKDKDELEELHVEMIDRFGLLPEATKTLFAVTRLKLRAQQFGINKIDASAASGRILFAQQTSIDPLSIVQLVQKHSRIYKLSGPTQLSFTHGKEKPAARIEFIEQTLDQFRLQA
ncbi:transcription-repair coupling factor [Pseudohongiella nitratireducens]|uniref:transcription-repair coupling factor n=1 Tax=Pseudohongiella nitratireducens TaxID=1768907 RepID=UPI0030ED8276|tara:strand:- start:4700 stop:8146 length:3447 start_codon:yes stop_codon:yes gene_type:complete